MCFTSESRSRSSGRLIKPTRVGQVGAVHRLSSPPRRQQKVDHFVVLYQENRAFDHMFGCMLGDKPGFDGTPQMGAAPSTRSALCARE